MTASHFSRHGWGKAIHASVFIPALRKLYPLK
jgi:hypothetical protein